MTAQTANLKIFFLIKSLPPLTIYHFYVVMGKLMNLNELPTLAFQSRFVSTKYFRAATSGVEPRKKLLFWIYDNIWGMGYPGVEGKYNLPSIISPVDQTNCKEGELETPAGIIITYQPSFVKQILASQGDKPEVSMDNFYRLKEAGDVGIVLCAFGASHAAHVMEDLIARGSKKFLNIGIAGAINPGLNFGDIVVCNGAVREEGVSHHYLGPGEYVYPSFEPNNKLKELLKNQKINYHEGTTWTTAMIYRETREEAEHYGERGVLTVDLETAALAAVAQFRKVEFGAAFVISDLLYGEMRKEGSCRNDVIYYLSQLHEIATLAF